MVDEHQNNIVCTKMYYYTVLTACFQNDEFLLTSQKSKDHLYFTEILKNNFILAILLLFSFPSSDFIVPSI